MIFIKSTKTVSEMLPRSVLEHGGHREQCGYFVESNEYSASANRTVADKPTFSDEYRKLKEMLVDSSTILVSGRRYSGGTATGVANRPGRFAGQGKRGIGIALSLPQRDFCSVRRFGDFAFSRCALTARGLDPLDMHGRLRCDFDGQQNFPKFVAAKRSWTIRRTLAGLGLFKTL